MLTRSQGQYFTVTQEHLLLKKTKRIKNSDFVVLWLVEVEYRRVVDARVGWLCQQKLSKFFAGVVALLIGL